MLREAEGGRKQGIRSGYHESVFCTTWNRSGKLILDEEMLMPGEHTTAHVFINYKLTNFLKIILFVLVGFS